MPSLVLDGTVVPVLHVSQVAGALGLPSPEVGEPARDAADALTVLEAWRDHVRELAPDVLVRPTRARGRTALNLTVNVFHPFELVPGAWESGSFDWRPEEDAEREAALADDGAVVDYTTRIVHGWRAFSARLPPGAGERRVDSSRGPLSLRSLLAFQRWHAAYHYRQLLAFAREAGIGLHGTVDVADFEDLFLPVGLY